MSIWRIAVAAACLGALSFSARAAELAQFRAGIAAPTVNMLPLWLARQAGFFQTHGLNVEIVDTDGGSRGLAEVGSGKLQAEIVGLSAVLDADGKGGHYVLIASGANTMSFRFFGAAGIRSAADLKGKKVGVSSFGSESDSAATMALRRLGLSRADVSLVEAGGTVARLRALKGGTIAATALNEPADTEASRGGLPLLADLKADLPWIFTAVAVDRNWLAAHRAEARAFLQGWVEGVHLALADPRRAKAVLAGEFPDFSPATVDAAYDDFRARVPRDAEPSQTGAELMIREAGARGGLADYVDTSILAELRSAGFFTSVNQRFHTE